MKMTEKQFEALAKWVYAVAEFEARKVHCEMTDDSYVCEHYEACDAERDCAELLVGEDNE